MDYETVVIDDDLLEVMTESAIDAGTHALNNIENTEQERKSDDTIVTEADKEAERRIRSSLEDFHPVVGEELGKGVGDADTYWVVDPIDGTQNYAYGQPLYATSIGFIEDDSLSRGVVYIPEFDDVYYAKKGDGAYCNTRQLSVNEDVVLDESYLGLSGFGSSEAFSPVAESTTWWLQRLSSAVITQCYAAQGRTDGAVIGEIHPWDFGAGLLIAREAGASVKHLKTGETEWPAVKDGGVVVANPNLADSILDALSEDTVELLTSE